MKHTVEQIKLSNGAEGLLVDVPGAPVVNFLFSFNAGYLLNDFSKYETPHLLEHLMGASKDFPTKNEFKAEVEKHGAYSNAHTNTENISYVYECAEFDWQRILKLLSVQLLYPVFNKAEIPAEKSNIKEELSSRLSDPATLAYRRLLFKLHGLPDDNERLRRLAKVEHSDVVKHYHKTHTAQNLRFIIAGKLSDKKDLLITEMENLLSELPHGSHQTIPRLPINKVKSPMLVYQDIKQIYYRFIVCRSAPFASKRVHEASLILKSILTDGYRSRILGEARKHGLAYALGSSVVRDLHESSLEFWGFVTPGNSSRLFTLIRKEILGIKKGKFTEQQFEESKTYRKGVFARSFQSVNALVSWYRPFINTGEFDRLDRYEDLLDSISKTEAVESFGSLLDDGFLASSYVGPIDGKKSSSLHSAIKEIAG